MVIKLLYVILFVYSVFSGLSYYYMTKEDAWISYKYARNLAEGFGLVQNPQDGIPQEGYSNFLFVLILAFFKFFLNIEIIHVSKIIGIISTLLLYVINYFLLLLYIDSFIKSLECDHENNQLSKFLTKYKKAIVNFLNMLFILIISSSNYMNLWATQGLETNFYSLQIYFIIYLVIKYISNFNYSIFYLISVISFLSLNTRPEGLQNFFIFSILIIYWMIINRRYEKNITKHLGLSVFVFIIFVSSLLTFKYLYFGDIVANPSYVKLGLSIWNSGTTYLLNYFKQKGLLFTTLFIFSIILYILFTLKSIFRSNEHFINFYTTTFFMFICSQVFLSSFQEEII